jgi:glutathionylspermidine synthase
MRRTPQDPRPNAYELVEAEGLAYAREDGPDGRPVPYWHEDAAYVFTEPEIDRLEQVTSELHEMSLKATEWMASDEPTLRRLGIPEYAWRSLRVSLDQDRSLYGRFDLVWDGESHPKLLEYNADTPAGLVEAALTQWSWLEARKPDRDQWNLLHERLVQAWRERIEPGEPVHLVSGEREPVEDWNTVAYVADTVQEAGGVPVVLPVERIGLVKGTFRLVDEDDQPLRTCFKMYPWEWMLAEDFGTAAVIGDTRWCEPLYKVLTGSKALLAVLWQLYPDHPNLLPTYWDADRLGPDFVVKPVYGWEGAGIRIVRSGEVVAAPQKHTSGQAAVYQEYRDIVPFDGALPVLGTWVINGHAAGLGIRESDHLITDTNARFLPHYIDAPRSTPDEVAGWLRE